MLSYNFFIFLNGRTDAARLFIVAIGLTLIFSLMRIVNLAHGVLYLTGGEQQMLAIGRALVTNPTLLIMDEPTEGLSPSVIHQIVETCKRLRDTGVSMLLTEQNLEVATALADRTLILETGRFIHQSNKTDFVDGDAFK